MNEDRTPTVPLVGRVSKAAVIAVFGRLVAAERCDCAECVAFGCEGPPVLEPAGVDIVPDPLEPEGIRHVAMGIWRHGARLREHERARGQFNDAMAAMVARLKAPGGHT